MDTVENREKKKRVYQVAKEFHLSNEELIDFLKKHKIKVRNHMAPLDEDVYALVNENFQSSETNGTKEADFRKKIIEKRVEEEARRNAIRQEISEMFEYSKEDIYESLAHKEVVEPQEVLSPQPVEEVVAVSEPEPPIQTQEEVVILEVDQKEPVPEESLPPKTEKALTVVEKERVQPKGESQQRKPEKREAGAESDKKDKDEKSSKDKPKRHLKRRPQSSETEDDDDKYSSKHKKKGKREEPKRAEDTEGDSEFKSSRKKKRKRKKTKVAIDEKEIEASIKNTLAKMDQTSKKKRRRKKDVDFEEEVEEDLNVIKVTEFVSVSELANLMDVPPNEVIQSCFSLGLMVSINQRLEKDTIVMVADEFGYEVEFMTEYGEDQVGTVEEEVEDPETLRPRPPVVTIMGHVDHGKTSLLDYFRESNIIAGESGGITQHIGAYEIDFNGRLITFLDTPGHEAFTAMRARGAQATDIVVLVVAADDRVMPQTIEAINHARAAGVPIVVAINKMDKPTANPELIKKELAGKEVLVEDWGGKVQAAEVSAKTGQGMDKLLEAILLEAEILELKANPDRDAVAVLIETRLDKGRGVVATVIVQKGTLRIGDPFVAGQYHGRVRAMFDERNNPVKEAPPSTPVQILGFTGMVQAGDMLVVVESEQEARDIGLKRQQLRREQSFRQIRRLTLDQISKQIAEGGVKELSVIIKGDVDGSVEALSDSLMELGTDDVSVRIIHKGVGAITEYDVLLAEASTAVIVGFHVAPNIKARELAQKEKIDIRLYKVIYDVVNDIKLALSGLLEPEKTEEVEGTVEIREVFRASKIGNIAGCYVTSGKIHRNSMIRLIRDGKVVYEGTIGTLKRFKEDVKEVASGFECGITIENYDDIRQNDTIEAYRIVEIARSL